MWFVIGSQHLYGPEALQQVTKHAEHVVNALNAEAKLPCKLVLKPLGTTRTKSPPFAAMPITMTNALAGGVAAHLLTSQNVDQRPAILNKPLLQFHTQFNASLPWDSIDMDFMNLNQTAHGGREFGFIGARMRQQHAVVTGHWQDGRTKRIGSGCVRRYLSRIPVT